MRYFFYFLIFNLGIAGHGFAQQNEDYLAKKNLNDSILQNRSLIVSAPFNAQKALLQLFPGKYYNLSKKSGYHNELINWECKGCKTKTYEDVNQDAVPSFPFAIGVATRLLNVMDYKDSLGTAYKVISFNHSEFDEDGVMTSRFTGGLLGLAKFVQTGYGWKLKAFQPAIAAYGAFSKCPEPKLLLIGQDQYAFMIKHSNGGGGGPFNGSYFLIAGNNGAYRQVMAAYGIEKTAVSEEENLCSWTSEYSVPPSEKKYFKDIIIHIKGQYTSSDKESLPEEVTSRLKGTKKGNFTMEQRFVYKAGKGYELQRPIKTTVN